DDVVAALGFVSRYRLRESDIGHLAQALRILVGGPEAMGDGVCDVEVLEHHALADATALDRTRGAGADQVATGAHATVVALAGEVDGGVGRRGGKHDAVEILSCGACKGESDQRRGTSTEGGGACGGGEGG